MASAAKNWSGLVTLCLGQEREKRQVSSQRTSLTKSNGVGALGVPPKPIIQYLPSYRMEPRNPLNKERLELTIWRLKYRYIVLVTVGELLMQGLCSMVNFLWDAEKDGFVTYSIKTPKFIAVCTIFYLYYD
ncbi:hypothetical protein AWZ03_007159 [Drosophila navojoa]|uniref:Uncharacterized protein n=1 Tax=Drosophila navojoa TaxID=7232 RepID=A0A484BF11_DRONA|nr:hypothetical protein AWZ03_007159 [Drosophila navojoa]